MYQKIRERQFFSRKDDFEREKKIKNGYREPIEVLFAYKCLEMERYVYKWFSKSFIMIP